jgi:hypothetical protein
LKERFLQGIVRVGLPPKQAPADHEQLRTMRRKERQEAIRILQGHVPPILECVGAVGSLQESGNLAHVSEWVINIGAGEE